MLCLCVKWPTNRTSAYNFYINTMASMGVYIHSSSATFGLNRCSGKNESFCSRAIGMGGAVCVCVCILLAYRAACATYK